MTAICTDESVHSGFDLNKHVVIAGKYMIWCYLIDFTLWCFTIQIMDFAGIQV